MANKLKGMGGHMTAALIHDIDVLYRIYDAKIAGAWMQPAAEYNTERLASERDRKILKIKDRLMERGYQYTMKHRPASASKPAHADLPEDLARALRFNIALRQIFNPSRKAA
jgi:hypothetical protein